MLNIKTTYQKKKQNNIFPLDLHVYTRVHFRNSRGISKELVIELTQGRRPGMAYRVLSLFVMF